MQIKETKIRFHQQVKLFETMKKSRSRLQYCAGNGQPMYGIIWREIYLISGLSLWLETKRK
jgi:hypothetical protein